MCNAKEITSDCKDSPLFPSRCGQTRSSYPWPVPKQPAAPALDSFLDSFHIDIRCTLKSIDLSDIVQGMQKNTSDCRDLPLICPLPRTPALIASLDCAKDNPPPPQRTPPIIQSFLQHSPKRRRMERGERALTLADFSAPEDVEEDNDELLFVGVDVRVLGGARK